MGKCVERKKREKGRGKKRRKSHRETSNTSYFSSRRHTSWICWKVMKKRKRFEEEEGRKLKVEEELREISKTQ